MLSVVLLLFINVSYSGLAPLFLLGAVTYTADQSSITVNSGVHVCVSVSTHACVYVCVLSINRNPISN